MLPRSLIQTSKAFQNINFAAEEKISKQTVDNYAKIKLNKNERVFYNLPEYRFNPIAYIPNMAGITAGKNIQFQSAVSALVIKNSRSCFLYYNSLFRYQNNTIFQGCFITFCCFTYDIISGCFYYHRTVCLYR